MRSSLVLCVFILSLLSCFILPSCGESKVTLNKATLKSTTKVEAQTYFRTPGQSPAIDLVVTVHDPKAQVTSVTIKLVEPLRDHDWVDLCCPWYRIEDTWGMTWRGKPEGDSFTVYMMGDKDALTQGTWVLHLFLTGEKIPVIESVSHTERYAGH